MAVFSCFLSPHTIFALLSPAPSVVVTQIWGHIAGYPSPATAARAFTFAARRVQFSTFFPRRFDSNCAYPRYL